MSNSDPSTPPNESVSRPEDLLQLTQMVQAAAQHREGDCLALLALLRLLNELHYEIRDTLFRESLPNNRQRLYRLLKDIEQEGGWPYIQRIKLAALMAHMNEAENSQDPSDTTNDTSREPI